VPPPPPKSIAILGAGITGLTAAHRLHTLGHGIRVFESSTRAGGVIRSERVNDWLVESGPNSLLSGEPAVERLLRELSLDSSVVTANPLAKNRYIVRRGQPLPVPLSPPALLSSSLLSPLAKLSLLREFLFRPRPRTSDLSLADFIRVHFSREIVDYALNPIVTGIYAGNPEKLSARHAFPKLWEAERRHGSLLRAQLAAAKARRARGEPPPAIVSFRDGLQTLPDTLAAHLPAGALTFNAQLDAIIPGEKWSVIWHDTAGTHTQSFDSIVVALPALALAQLRVGAFGERPLAGLASIEHPPVASLFLGLRRDQIAHPLDGFGLLVPAVENRSILGVLFSSTLFPHRAPANHVALTVLIGGTRQPELASLPGDQLLDRIRPDLADLLGVNGAPVFQRHAFWPRAIPQYNLGHEQHLAAIAHLERTHRGLFLGGQARDGISLPACIAAGESLATRAATSS
jgi:protoporphyrinogen oxidase